MTDKLPPASQSKRPLHQDSGYKTEVASGSDAREVGHLSFSPQPNGSTHGDDQSMLATHSFFEKVTSICQSYKESVAKIPGHGQLREYLVQVAKEDQPTLLRNLLEFDVQQRRKSGQAPVPQDYIDVLPEHDSLIRRVFLDISSISISGGWKIDAPETHSVDAPIASRLGDYWRIHHERFQSAVDCFQKACRISRENRYVVTYNSWIVSDYAYALRLLIEAKENDGERIEKTLVRRWFQVARWANRLSLLLPPERPRALRELAWTYAHSKKLAKSSKLFKLSSWAEAVLASCIWPTMSNWIGWSPSRCHTPS